MPDAHSLNGPWTEDEVRAFAVRITALDCQRMQLEARVAALEAENQQLRARSAADDSEADRADLFALCDIRRRLAELEAENQQLKAVIARIKAVRSWESLARIFKGEEG